jgi:hypothetical protein
MKYLDVRVRIPIYKLGFFIEDMPPYAQMVGYDKLGEEEPKNKRGRKPIPNGEYVPGKGTAAEAIMKLMAKGPMKLFEVKHALESKLHTKSITSGFYNLRNHGLIQKQTDGSYALTH